MTVRPLFLLRGFFQSCVTVDLHAQIARLTVVGSSCATKAHSTHNHFCRHVHMYVWQGTFGQSAGAFFFVVDTSSYAHHDPSTSFRNNNRNHNHIHAVRGTRRPESKPMSYRQGVVPKVKEKTGILNTHGSITLRSFLITVNVVFPIWKVTLVAHLSLPQAYRQETAGTNSRKYIHTHSRRVNMLIFTTPV